MHVVGLVDKLSRRGRYHRRRDQHPDQQRQVQDARNIQPAVCLFLYNFSADGNCSLSGRLLYRLLHRLFNCLLICLPGCHFSCLVSFLPGCHFSCLPGCLSDCPISCLTGCLSDCLTGCLVSSRPGRHSPLLKHAKQRRHQERGAYHQHKQGAQRRRRTVQHAPIDQQSDPRYGQQDGYMLLRILRPRQDILDQRENVVQRPVEHQSRR